MRGEGSGGGETAAVGGRVDVAGVEDANVLRGGEGRSMKGSSSTGVFFSGGIVVAEVLVLFVLDAMSALLLLGLSVLRTTTLGMDGLLKTSELFLETGDFVFQILDLDTVCQLCASAMIIVGIEILSQCFDDENAASDRVVFLVICASELMLEDCSFDFQF